MKKIYLYLLLIIIFLGVVKALEVEHSVKATVTVNPVAGALIVEPDKIEINTPPLSLVEKNIKFKQDGNIDLNVSLYLENKIKDWFSFSENEFIVKSNETKDIITYINIPNIEGIYSTNIHATANSQDLIIPVIITVTKNYKIDINIDVSPKIVNPGQNISILTKVEKSKLKKTDKEVEGRIRVNVVYNILKGRSLVTSYTTTIDVIDYTEKTISIPAPDINGSYTIEAIATHLDKVAKDKDNFLVRKNWLRRFIEWFRR